MTFSCQSDGICRLYHSNLIVLHYKGLGNGWPLIFNTKEIQIQMNCKTISSRTQKWSNLLYPQLFFNLKGRPIRMIAQNGSAFSLPSPLSHEVLHQSENRRLWTHNRLREGWKKKSPMNDTPHHGLFPSTIGETKKKNVTPYVSS